MLKFITYRHPYHFLCLMGKNLEGKPLCVAVRLRSYPMSVSRELEANDVSSKEFERYAANGTTGMIEVNPFGTFIVPERAQVVNARALQGVRKTSGPMSRKFRDNMKRG